MELQLDRSGVGGGGPGLAWSDDFNNINTATWNHEVGGDGWGNNEREYYTAGNNAFIQFDSQAGSNVPVLEARRTTRATTTAGMAVANTRRRA